MRSIIEFFVKYKIWANAIIFVIFVGGFYSLLQLKNSAFPLVASTNVLATVIYPGASPQEIEEGIVLKIEQAIEDITGITKVQSTADSGIGRVYLNVGTDHDVYVVMDEVKVAIDGITTFPDQAESPTVAKFQLDFTKLALQIQVSGDLDEFGRREVAEDLRQELLNLKEISQVDLFGDRPFEVTIEVSEQTLRKYGLNLSDVSDAVQRASVDIPGGKIRTVNGDILLRTKDKAYRQYQFEY